ncbi:hypothetical protein CHX26_09135 [Porphyrobacter sp. HT-58-2]|uniref:tyrosine-type recombinase/integrase n=1 Tax=Porphyrobacter sp. HT-58-2 TaxID=2023229 RepID=UPI000CDCBF50|nr:hypothetical protein CHX26_09135 [Porphyrobacter sp. HT-58-2]
MLALGYGLLARQSELVGLRDSDVTDDGTGTLRVFIRRSKSDPFRNGQIAYTSRRTADLLRGWVAMRGPGTQWLFCPIYRGKIIDRCREKTTVRRIIYEAAAKAGLTAAEIAAFSGHSMRVGAARDLLKRGFDIAAIMRAGGGSRSPYSPSTWSRRGKMFWPKLGCCDAHIAGVC